MGPLLKLFEPKISRLISCVAELTSRLIHPGVAPAVKGPRRRKPLSCRRWRSFLIERSIYGRDDGFICLFCTPLVPRRLRACI